VPNILEAAEHQEMLRKLVRSSGLILLCFAVGIAGYTIVGGEKYGFVDALYMTIITLTTVGYGEAIDLSHGPGGKLFTSFLLMFGVGSFIYFFSTLTAFMVEGSLGHMVGRRRMKRTIDNMSGHYVVCGVGGTGECIVQELYDT
jgi:voltage-gated potassium channel